MLDTLKTFWSHRPNSKILDSAVATGGATSLRQGGKRQQGGFGGGFGGVESCFCLKSTPP